MTYQNILEEIDTYCRRAGLKPSTVCVRALNDSRYVARHQRRLEVLERDACSAPKMTRAKLECGLQRAMALNAGLKGQIVHAGDGVDLNDVLIGTAPKEGDKQ